jgi:hypothetical protein
MDSQSLATAKWQKKKGLISKSYKLEKKLVEAYAEAVEAAETTQAKALSIYMKRYIYKHHPDGKDAL